MISLILFYLEIHEPFLSCAHPSLVHFEPTWKGKISFSPWQTLFQGIVVEGKKKEGGANRRVELDKLARLQIRDWNLRIVRETDSKKIKKFCDYLFLYY